MYVYYISVGQADATLLEFPCGAILIDAGAQDDNYSDTLVNYLKNFFDKRPDLNNTLEAIIIIHNHIDYIRVLKDVVKNFTVKRYIDNGQTQGVGTGTRIGLERKQKIEAFLLKK
jgi:beta-lactamase superfamily II metal-dependent hydrolase